MCWMVAVIKKKWNKKKEQRNSAHTQAQYEVGELIFCLWKREANKTYPMCRQDQAKRTQ